MLCGYFERQRRVQFEGCVAKPLQTITAILLRSKWSCLLLRIVLQDALGEATNLYPPLIQQGLKLPITEGGKEGKGKAITFCENLEERFQKCSKKEGVVLATSVETLGVDLRTRTKQLGSEEEDEKKEVQCEILAYHEKSVPRKG